MRCILEGVVAALAYHDGFDFPLTSQEIRSALWAQEGSRPSFEDIEAALGEAARRGVIGNRDGYYFLPKRENLVAIRKARYLLAEDKYKRVLRFLALARFTPFLRAVFVCNTLARSCARPESDIDLYVVAAPGRIWLTRLCVTGLAAILRVRPTAEIQADRICLSFFVTEDALDLRALAIEGDVYLPHWLQELYPIYDEAGIVRRSFVENGWLRDLLPETRVQTPSRRRMIVPRAVRLKRAFERLLDRAFGDRLEDRARRLQHSWLPAALRAAASTPASDVILSDTILKFHDRDRRAEIRDAYREKLAKIFVIPTEGDIFCHPERSAAESKDLFTTENRSLDFARDDKREIRDDKAFEAIAV